MTEHQGLEKSKIYFASDSALKSLERDPYWRTVLFLDLATVALINANLFLLNP